MNPYKNPIAKDWSREGKFAMAGKQQKGKESKKRKGISGPKKEEKNPSFKMLKLQSSNLSQKGSKKLFKSSGDGQQHNQYEVKQKTRKGEDDTNKQRRLRAKVLFV